MFERLTMVKSGNKIPRLGLLFGLSMCWMGPLLSLQAIAQTEDVYPPSIEHEVAPFAEEGNEQSFEATVVDEGGVDTVVLSYRIASNDDSYHSLNMSLLGSDSYSAVVRKELKGGDVIEYYITAIDKAGNRSASGFNFAPLVREVTSAASDQLALESPPKKISRVNILYVALGVLAAGAVAGLVSSGGGGDGGDSQDCPVGGCSLTLTLTSPR